MLFDPKSLKIITKSLNFTKKEQDEFIASHYRTVNRYILSEFVRFSIENTPEKMQEIEKLLESNNEEKIKKAFNILQDQIKFTRFVYPELDKKIRLVIKKFESKLFFSFLEFGPKEGIDELIEYFDKRIDQVDYYKKLYNRAKKMLEEKEKLKDIAANK